LLVFLGGTSIKTRQPVRVAAGEAGLPLLLRAVLAAVNLTKVVLKQLCIFIKAGRLSDISITEHTAPGDSPTLQQTNVICITMRCSLCSTYETAVLQWCNGKVRFSSPYSRGSFVTGFGGNKIKY